jgi:hypothetical protein
VAAVTSYLDAGKVKIGEIEAALGHRPRVEAEPEEWMTYKNHVWRQRRLEKKMKFWAQAVLDGKASPGGVLVPPETEEREGLDEGERLTAADIDASLADLQALYARDNEGLERSRQEWQSQIPDILDGLRSVPLPSTSATALRMPPPPRQNPA